MTEHAFGYRPTHAAALGANVDRVPEYDPVRREHYWLMIVAYHVDPSNVDSLSMLDQENLATLTGPGCYYCERHYSGLIARRPCSGHPPAGM